MRNHEHIGTITCDCMQSYENRIGSSDIACEFSRKLHQALHLFLYTAVGAHMKTLIWQTVGNSSDGGGKLCPKEVFGVEARKLVLGGHSSASGMGCFDLAPRQGRRAIAHPCSAGQRSDNPARLCLDMRLDMSQMAHVRTCPHTYA